MISVVWLMSVSANTLWAPPVSLTALLPSFFAGIQEQVHKGLTHESSPIFKKTWRSWDGVGRPMHQSQLLFYLPHVYFSRERCSLSKVWDHPGQWSSLETDGLIRWASLGTSCLTSQEIGWEIQSYCTTDPGIQILTHTNFRKEGRWTYGNPYHIFLSKPLAVLPESPLLIYSLMPPPRPHHVPVRVHWPTWKLASDLKIPVLSRFLWLPHSLLIKETGSPNSPRSLWPLLYFICLFIDFATAHTGAQRGSVYSTKPVSECASFARKSRQF